MSGYRVTQRDLLAYRLVLLALRLATRQYRAYVYVAMMRGAKSIDDELWGRAPLNPSGSD